MQSLRQWLIAFKWQSEYYEREADWQKEVDRFNTELQDYWKKRLDFQQVTK